MTKPYFQKNGWNKIEDRVDVSAWARLNDVIWEPRHVPVRKDKKEFISLPNDIQTTVLHEFTALITLSTLQVRTGLDQVKQDSQTPEEFAVFNALAYLESIANKGYNYVLKELATPEQINEAFDWAANNEPLQRQLAILNNTLQKGSIFQKKTADVLLETSLYHSNYYGILYLFGQGKLKRTAEIIKLALRGTSFAGIYPGYKARTYLDGMSKQEQDKLSKWVNNYTDKILVNEKKHLNLLYGDIDWYDDAYQYLQYSLNKALLNLGLQNRFPADSDSVNQTAMTGLVKSAVFGDFFYYTNKNSLTHYTEIKNDD